MAAKLLWRSCCYGGYVVIAAMLLWRPWCYGGHVVIEVMLFWRPCCFGSSCCYGGNFVMAAMLLWRLFCESPPFPSGQSQPRKVPLLLRQVPLPHMLSLHPGAEQAPEIMPNLCTYCTIHLVYTINKAGKVKLCLQGAGVNSNIIII